MNPQAHDTEAPMPVALTLEQLATTEGLDLGTSDWITITQDDIDGFATVTRDHQWIHTDPEKAKTGPFGGTIAHGYLTVALIPALVSRTLELPDATMGVNYGIDKLRLTSPVPAGARIRGHARLVAAERRHEGVRYSVEITVEVEGTDRPALVGNVLFLAY